MTRDPIPEPLPPDEEYDAQRTTEELADILDAGDHIEAALSDDLHADISTEGVGIWIRFPLDDRAVGELAAGLGGNELRLALDPQRIHDLPLQLADPAELMLLARALEARARVRLFALDDHGTGESSGDAPRR